MLDTYRKRLCKLWILDGRIYARLRVELCGSRLNDLMSAGDRDNNNNARIQHIQWQLLYSDG